MNPREAKAVGFKPGIIEPGPQQIEEISQLEPGKREVLKGRLAAGLALMLTGYLTTACGPIQAREPTPEVTETTGIPPTPEITSIPTEIPFTPIKEPTPIKTPPPEPTSTPEAPAPVPTVTVEAVGFGMGDLTPEEQALAVELETSYRTATENQGLKEGVIYLTYRDQVGEISGYFKDKKGFWYLVEREGEVILEEVPPLMGTSLAWNQDEVRFEYQPQGVPHNWIWKPRERMVYDPIKGINVAQWNPETSSWTMNSPELRPENWTYIEGVEHVKFAEFNQEQLQMLKEAVDLVKQYDPERFALFEREIDWVTLSTRGSYWRYKIFVKPLSQESITPKEIKALILAGKIWGHEFQHRIQEINGIDFGVICRDQKLAEEIEIGKDGAYRAQKELIQKIRAGISSENQLIVDNVLANLDKKINKIIPFDICFSGEGS